MKGYPNRDSICRFLKEAFGFSEDFSSQLYRTEFLSDDNIYYYEDYGKLVSMLSVTEYPFNFGSGPLYLISCGASRMDSKGKMMTTFILRECLVDLCRRCRAFAAVFPENGHRENFNNMGFSEAFFVHPDEYTVYPSDRLDVVRVSDPDRVYGVYRKKYESMDKCCWKTRNRFLTAAYQFNEIPSSGGLFSIGDGMAFVSFIDGATVVREYAGIDKNTLVGSLYETFRNRVIVDEPGDLSDEPVGLLRITSVREVAYRAAKQGGFSFRFDITDPIVPANNVKIAVEGNMYDDSYDGDAEKITVKELGDYLVSESGGFFFDSFLRQKGTLTYD